MLDCTLETFFVPLETRRSHDAIRPLDEVSNNCQFPVVSVLGAVSDDEDISDFRMRCLLSSSLSVLLS